MVSAFSRKLLFRVAGFVGVGISVELLGEMNKGDFNKLFRPRVDKNMSM